MCSASPKIIKWHLDHGADPNIVDFRAQEPCVYAAYGGNLESVKLLMEGGTSVPETRALIAAAGAKDFKPDVADYLLGLGVDINRLERDKDDEGNAKSSSSGAEGTALHRAVESGDVERVRFLLERGADPSVRGLPPQAMTPLELAEMYQLDEVSEVLRGGGATTS